MNVAVLATARRIDGRVNRVARSSVWVKLTLVGLLTLLAFVIPRLAGGSPTPLNNLGYAPILIAAYLFGWRGGLVTGMLNTLTVGPLPTVLGFPGTEAFESTIARGVFFAGVGALTGHLFDLSRKAMDGWRAAAETIYQREREAMVALARGAEAKDAGTADHIRRVQDLSHDLARRLGLEEPRAADIGWAAVLHDVGKLHVPDRILLKPGPLSSAELRIMRQHTIWGEEILAHGEGFELARRVARWHHENFDGTGYPDRLRNDDIPLEARIVRVVDAFDAMTNDRPYRPAIDPEKALEELLRFAGLHFDPDVVQAMLELAQSAALVPAAPARNYRARPRAAERGSTAPRGVAPKS